MRVITNDSGNREETGKTKGGFFPRSVVTVRTHRLSQALLQA